MIDNDGPTNYKIMVLYPLSITTIPGVGSEINWVVVGKFDSPAFSVAESHYRVFLRLKDVMGYPDSLLDNMTYLTFLDSDPQLQKASYFSVN